MTSAVTDRLRRIAARVAPGSVAVRATAIIFALALLLGLAFALSSARIVHRREDARLMHQLRQLVSTVGNTAQIACYLRDKALAREIATGLMKSDAVGGVRIASNHSVLYQTFRGHGAAHQRRLKRIVRAMHSPFDKTQTVGTVTLYLSRAQLRERAWGYTRFVLLILALEVLVISAGTALVVYFVVTHPIKRLSDALHRLREHDSPFLPTPSGNESDEIGRLVADVNALFSKLDRAVATERTLKIQHQVAENKLRLVLKQTELGICIMSAEGAVHSWNPAFIRLLRLDTPPEEGHSFVQFEPLTAHAQRIRALFERAQLDGQACEADLEIQPHTSGECIWVELSINPLGPDLLLAVLDDITDRKQSVAAAQELAMRDPLTGLLNRRGLDTELSRLFDEGAQRDWLALLAVDLDWFKQINDSLGHAAGDEVLRHVGNVIETSVRGSDVVSRMGGDEFVAILIGEGHVLRAREIAKEILARLAAPLSLQGGKTVTVGASIGVAMAREREDSPAALLRRADAAMYASKQSGRGRVCVEPPEAA